MVEGQNRAIVGFSFDGEKSPEAAAAKFLNQPGAENHRARGDTLRRVASFPRRSRCADAKRPSRQGDGLFCRVPRQRLSVRRICSAADVRDISQRASSIDARLRRAPGSADLEPTTGPADAATGYASGIIPGPRSPELACAIHAGRSRDLKRRRVESGNRPWKNPQNTGLALMLRSRALLWKISGYQRGIYWTCRATPRGSRFPP